jgi:DNA-binding Lrp family transcriptional regulator
VLTAIVMLQSRPDRIPEVAAEVASIKGVREVYSVTGDVEGIVQTRTYLAFRTYTPSDIDDALASGFGEG